MSVSEFTSTGLEERSQLALAAWAVRVCVGGGYKPLGAPRLPSGCSTPDWERLPGHRPLQPSTNGSCIKGVPPDGGIP